MGNPEVREGDKHLAATVFLIAETPEGKKTLLVNHRKHAEVME